MFTKQEVIYLAGGCFWQLESKLSRLNGVNQTEVGYANGNTISPTFEMVIGQKTGHTLTVKVTFNPQLISLSELLDEYYTMIDPFKKTKSYLRCGIYWQSPNQEKIIKKFLKAKKIAIETSPIFFFYTAEEKHQKYLETDDITKEFEVTQLSIDEEAFSGKYCDFYEDGIYVDVIDGEELFSSKDKVKTDSGWPTFTKPINESAITKNRDFSYGRTRIEIRSAKSNSHLGYLVYEGPNGDPRYRINSASLKFIPKK